VSNITLISKPKIWAIVTGGDGIPCVYQVGDYEFTPRNILFLCENSSKDPYPLTIVNLAYKGSVDFTKEKPEMMTMEDIANLEGASDGK